MRKFLILILILSVLLPTIGLQVAKVHNLMSNVTSTKDNAIPACIDISRCEGGLLVSFSLEEYELTEDDIYPGAFTISIPGFGVTKQCGWLNYCV